MKYRLYIIILVAVMAVSATAQTIGEAFYIYRNDGGFNAFFRDEVQNIEYSNYDADGNYYDEIVTQIVNTPDSIYMIPLAAIDSLSFVQPVPVYAENTIELSGQLVDYIISVEGLVINFRSDTPVGLLPKVGDKLAQLGFTNVFPDGFVGQVTSVTSHDGMFSVTCESLTMDDVVTSYSAVYRLDVVGKSNYMLKSRKAPSSEVLFDHTLPSATIPIHINLEALGGVWKNETLHEETGLGGSGDFKIDITPTFDIKVTYYRNDLLGIFPRYNVHAVTDVEMTEELQLMGLITGERKWPAKLPPLLERLKDYPVAPGVTVYLDAGLKVSGNGRLGAGAVFEQQIRHTEDINFYPLLAPLIPPLSTANHHIELKGHDEEWLYFLGDFEAKIGPYLEMGFGFINHKVSKVGAEFDFGAKIGGKVKFDPVAWGSAETKTDFYDNCKDESKVTFDVYLGGSLLAAVLDERLKFSLGGDIDLKRFHDEASLLPSFSNVKLQQNASKLKFSANVGNKCIFPLQIGGALFKSESSRLQTVQYQDKYWTPGSFTSYGVDFTDVPMLGEYTAYPTVRMFGKDILASPSADLDLKFPVELSNFKVTDSQFQQNGFSHDGRQYDYCFNVSVTATLDNDAENIAEWGYVYLDPNGQEAFIPLSGHTYTDTRYAYYRNEPHSTCTLYGYVKYTGSNEPIYGEPHDYPMDYEGETTCPDANHPHWIDLGLPSGTQWRCCNEGASTPEAYGGYYTFGQVSSAPTLDQIRELVNNCSYTWTTQNGVNGGKFTGPNGGTIFLPAAGYRRNGEFYYVGSWGYCWSSTPYGEYYGCDLVFGSDDAGCSYDWRIFRELPVRPVR